jgi:hypothetical protein
LRIEAHRVIIVCTLLVESRRTTGPLANEDRSWLTLISRVDHFKGDDLWGETIFFDNASILKQIGAEIDIPPPSGLPVFWTCRKDHLAQLHFDIRQYNCIDWMDEPDLAKRLQRRIEAVIGRGPVKQTDAG